MAGQCQKPLGSDTHTFRGEGGCSSKTFLGLFGILLLGIFGGSCGWHGCPSAWLALLFLLFLFLFLLILLLFLLGRFL